MERLDKFISNQTSYSRSEIKKLALKSKIKVNDVVQKKCDIKINPDEDKIEINGEIINYTKHIYLILNKPEGYVSATKDNNDKTVLDLIDEKYKFREIFPAGRLDKDTTGLMIITDDGDFSHNILSPSKHVSKTYIATLDIDVNQKMVDGFEKGVNLNDGVCKKAYLERLDENIAKVIISEGRYHQVKRMFGCFGAKVLKLHRQAFGNLVLPSDLKPGEYRELTSEELNLIKEK